MNLTLLMPSIPATISRRAAKEMPSPSYELTFCPIRVTSATPAPARPLTSSSISALLRLTSLPRVYGTMQYAQKLLQPRMIETNAFTPSTGLCACPYSSSSMVSVWAVATTPALRPAPTSPMSSLSLWMLCGPKTRSRYGALLRSAFPCCCATQPLTAIIRPGFSSFSALNLPSVEYTFCSALSRTEHVLSMMRSASAGASVRE